MLLAVNVGNSQTHIGVFSGEELTSEWRVSTQARRTSDELALIFQELLSFEGLSFSRQVTGVVVSYAEYDEAELDSYAPLGVHVNEDNRIVTVDDAVAELLS